VIFLTKHHIAFPRRKKKLLKRTQKPHPPEKKRDRKPKKHKTKEKTGLRF
jgi:hypothetical protein